ncbi:putative ribonuclease H domain, reverse transcriptase zinc-binding domain-containing protein [Arabidopsis thaliana]
MLTRPHGSLDLKNKVWNLPIMPKLKHFLWRVLSGALATKERLITRGMRIDPTCSRCRQANESINHALFTCPFATIAWRLADIQSLQTNSFSDDIEDNISTVLSLTHDNTSTDFQKLLSFWLLWRIWKARNNSVFNDFRESSSTTVLKAQAETKEWLNATRIQPNSSPRPQTNAAAQKRWTPPPPRTVKCNFDASYNVQNLEAIGDWIIRDHDGISQHWGSLSLDHTSNPLEAEAKALLTALQQTWIRGYTRVIMEGDSQTLIHLVNGFTSNGSLTNILMDIHLWAAKFLSIKFCFIRREGNTIAHDLAKSAYNSFSFMASSNSPVCFHHLCNNTP